MHKSRYCFAHFCLTSHSKNASLVPRGYLSLERVLHIFSLQKFFHVEMNFFLVSLLIYWAIENNQLFRLKMVYIVERKNNFASLLMHIQILNTIAIGTFSNEYGECICCTGLNKEKYPTHKTRLDFLLMIKFISF